MNKTNEKIMDETRPKINQIQSKIFSILRCLGQIIDN